MSQHRPPPLGRNEMVSGSLQPETMTTNQNKWLYSSEVLAGWTSLYTDGDVMSKRGHGFVAGATFRQPYPSVKITPSVQPKTNPFAVRGAQAAPVAGRVLPLSANLPPSSSTTIPQRTKEF
jgi:hypothetical protein